MCDIKAAQKLSDISVVTCWAIEIQWMSFDGPKSQWESIIEFKCQFSYFFLFNDSNLLPWHLPTFLKYRFGFYFFVFFPHLTNSPGCRPSTRPELGKRNTEESKDPELMLDGIMKRPEVTSSDEWLFQGSNQVAQNQKEHHFYPTLRYNILSTKRYVRSNTVQRTVLLWKLFSASFCKVFTPHSSIIYLNELSREKARS